MHHSKSFLLQIIEVNPFHLVLMVVVGVVRTNTPINPRTASSSLIYTTSAGPAKANEVIYYVNKN